MAQITDIREVEARAGRLLSNRSQEFMIKGTKVIIAIPAQDQTPGNWYYAGEIFRESNSTFGVSFDGFPRPGKGSVAHFWKKNGSIYGNKDSGIHCYLDTGRPYITDEELTSRFVMCQRLFRGKWEDFFTLRDRDDVKHTYQLVEGTHASFAGQYRIVFNTHPESHPDYRKPYDLGILRR